MEYDVHINLNANSNQSPVYIKTYVHIAKYKELIEYFRGATPNNCGGRLYEIFRNEDENGYSLKRVYAFIQRLEDAGVVVLIRDDRNSEFRKPEYKRFTDEELYEIESEIDHIYRDNFLTNEEKYQRSSPSFIPWEEREKVMEERCELRKKEIKEYSKFNFFLTKDTTFMTEKQKEKIKIR